ncbi:ATP-binding protein [Catenulispora subtropica]
MNTPISDAAPSPVPVTLYGRAREQEVLDRLLLTLRGGRSRALVLRGESGAGKTALLAYLAAHPDAGRVVRTAGVETMSEIAYSNLHELCAPLMDRLGLLSPAQQEALATALGLSLGLGLDGDHGGSPGHLTIGLAVLDLFAEAAADEPLVCVVDDAQWVDRMSAAILAFVARRLDAEAVGLVFAVNTTASALAPANAGLLAGLPELRVEGLGDEDARALLAAVLPDPDGVDPAVLDRIVAEARGNPLALLELPRNPR